MKIFPPSAILASITLFAISAPAAVVINDFNSSTDLNSFTQKTSANGATQPTGTPGLVQAAGTGTGIPASGGVIKNTASTSADVFAIYNGSSFSFINGGPITFSLDLHKAVTAAGTTVFQQGFGSTVTDSLGTAGTAGISFRISTPSTNNGQLQLTNGTVAGGQTTTAIGSTFAFNNANTDWYQMNVTLALTNSLTNTFSYTVNLYDIGSTGTTAPGLGSLVTSFSGSVVNADIATDSTTYYSFRQITASVSGIDNLSIVPEPGTVALTTLGLTVFLGFFRRKTRQSRVIR